MTTRALSIWCGTASLMMLTSAMAQAPEGEPADSALRPLDEIVVTAQRRTDRLQDVPFSVTAVSETDLTDAGIVSTKSLQQIVPGLTWASNGVWAQPALRGVTTTVSGPTTGGPIAIYLDGIYQPKQDGTLLDVADVSSIEVLKGPQGTLFGRNASGGAILIQTLSPNLYELEGKVSLDAGVYTGGDARTAEHYLAKGFVSVPLIDSTLAASFSGWAEYTPGYIDEIRTGARLGDVEVYGARGKLLWAAGDNTEVLLSGYYSDRSDAAAWSGSNPIGVGAMVARNPDGSLVYPDVVLATRPWTSAFSYPAEPRYWLETYGAALKITHDIDGLGTLTSSTAYDNSVHRSHTGTPRAYSPSCYAAFTCLEYEANVEDDVLSTELIFNSEQFGRVQFVAGLFAFYHQSLEDDSGSTGSADFSNLTLVFNAQGEHTVRAYAAFAEGNFDLTDKLTLVAGARFNYDSRHARGGTFGGPMATYADKSWENVSPRLSLKYEVTDRLNVYATYSTGFKAGASPTFFTQIDPITDPEKMYAYEVGMKYASPRLSMSSAVFYYDYKDYQAESSVDYAAPGAPPVRVVVPRNATSAEIIGVDFDVTAQLTPEFKTRLGASWLPRARYGDFTNAIAHVPPLGPRGLTTDFAYDASGVRMNRAPKFTGSLSAEYATDTRIGEIAASATLYYSSEFRFEYTARIVQEAYETLAMQVSLTPSGYENLRLSLYGRNLTNSAYITGGNFTANDTAAFWGPPRELGMNVTLNF